MLGYGVRKFLELGPRRFAERAGEIVGGFAVRCWDKVRPLVAWPRTLLYRYYRARGRTRTRAAFPPTDFVGPYEANGAWHAIFPEQWLWSRRSLIRGDVLDMSTPRELNRFIEELPGVTSLKISNLDDEYVEKMGFRTKVDIVGDFCAETLPVPEESFDTVLCLSVIEHCEEPQAMVRNIGRILRPGGVGFVLCPYAYIDGHMTPDYWRIGRDGLLLLVNRAGLETVEVGQFDDLGDAYIKRYGYNASARNGHRGIPMATWIIFRKPDPRSAQVN